MKKIAVALLLTLLLSGCGAKETLETVADDIPLQPVLAQPAQISVRLPDNAVSPVLESDTEQVYFCEDYEIAIETRASGDLSCTITAMTGFDPEQLTVMHTSPDGVDRYEFVWAAAGEDGDRLGRGVVLDDGSYHYCMSVLRDAQPQKKSQVVWSDVFASFSLA
ncbi:MAG: hypothetical protein MSS60_01345 [Clostridiales bacterium]|nr:hypothetical protein [Clostridiales bacterium]